MTMPTTDHIIDDIIQREGGFVDNPDDRGGPTKFGITLAALREYHKADRLEAADIAALTKAEAETILRSNYVDRPGFNQIANDQVRAFLVDWGVNSGPATAIKHLQILLPGCRADGVLGPDTAKIANTCDQIKLLNHLITLRLDFVHHLVKNDPNQAQFLGGWVNRIEEFNHA